MPHIAMTPSRVSPLHTACLAILLFAISFAPDPAHAGGDASPGTVHGFARRGGGFSFRFSQVDSQRWMFAGCREIEVTVAYERVPWYSWLPSVRTNHPTRAQTREAGALLEDSGRRKVAVAFGLVGHGLEAGRAPCSFLSRGLEIHDGAVYSFFRPV